MYYASAGERRGDRWVDKFSYEFELLRLVENQPFSFQWFCRYQTSLYVRVRPVVDHLSFSGLIRDKTVNQLQKRGILRGITLS